MTKRRSKTVNAVEDAIIQRGRVKYKPVQKPKPKHWLHQFIKTGRGIWCTTCDEQVNDSDWKEADENA